MPAMNAKILPPMGRYSSSRRMSAPTVQTTSVQAVMIPIRARASRQPSAP
jgi:hypothetical protein